MRLVRDVMSHKTLYLTREATVRSAVELVRGHEAEVVPVMDGGRVVGLVDALLLTLYEGETSVMEAALDPLWVETTTPLAEAGRLMRGQRLRQLPVLQSGELVGTLSAGDLLRVWGQVNDALTHLPVQYQLRDWVSRHLAGGIEVVILFLDLNDFGVFNKRHGHVFGDRVLQRVADVLRESTDGETDFAARMGGDEFCLATIRRLPEARELAGVLRDQIAHSSIEGQPVEIGVSIGLSGGRRLTPRPGAHTEATLDNLITRASTASTTAKKLPGRIHEYGDGEAVSVPELPREPGAAETRIQVEGYRIAQTGSALEVSVSLRSGPEIREARLSVNRGELNRGLATAATRCLSQLTGERIELEVEDTYEYSTPHGLACVGATVVLTPPSAPPERLVGAAPVREDEHRAYVNAVLDAANRRLGLY